MSRLQDAQARHHAAVVVYAAALRTLHGCRGTEDEAEAAQVAAEAGRVLGDAARALDAMERERREPSDETLF